MPLTIQLGDDRALVVRWPGRGGNGSKLEVEEFALELPLFPLEVDDLAGVAEGLLERVGRDSVGPDSVRLVIPTEWCLTRLVAVPTVRWSAQAAAFAAEPWFPIELERLTFAAHRVGGGRALVTAVVTKPFEGMFGKLEEGGICVESMAPDLALAGRCLFETQEHGAGGSVFVGRRVIVVAGWDQDCRSWRGIRAIPRALGGADGAVWVEVRRTVAVLSRGRDRWYVVADGNNGAADAASAAVAQVGRGVEVVTRAGLLARSIRAATRGRAALELRCGALQWRGRWRWIYGQVRRTLFAAALALMAWAVQLRVANGGLDRAIAAHVPIRDQTYGRVFPGRPVPTGAALMVRSERLKLQGLTQDVALDALDYGPTGLEILRLLNAIVTRIPSDVKLNVNELFIDGRMLRLAGRTLSHSDAGRLVQALNLKGRVALDPPQTKLRRDGTVEFRIRGTWGRDGSD